jgi:hypothetical protein
LTFASPISFRCGQPQGILQRIETSQIVLTSRSQDAGDENIQEMLIGVYHLRMRFNIKLNGKLINDLKVASWD